VNTVSPESVGFSSKRLERIDQVICDYVERDLIPGAVALVARRGEVVYHKAFGLMDVASKKPMALDTLLRMYSMTKPITSVAVMMLFEEGRLHLSDPVSKFIPAFEDLKVFVRETETGVELANLERAITVHDLLTHTSGLSYGFDPNVYVDRQIAKHMWQAWEKDREITLEEMVKNICKCPLLFQPGAKWSYSLATDVLGYLVQVVSGQPFDAFLQERILDPLGMQDTTFHVPPEKLDRFATNYRPGEQDGIEVLDKPETSRYAKPTRCPAGGMGSVSTVADYYRFAQMLANRGVLDGERLLGRKTVERMATNHLRDGIYRDGNPALGFGLGFGVTIDGPRTQGLVSTGAYGWGGAATTRFSIDPQEDLVYVAGTQLMDNMDRPILDDIGTAIYQAIED
jgi:CubicO group peptidase (beta-lactamase class C family)